MDRASIENTIRQAYDARLRGDLDGVMTHFADHASFALAGCRDSSPVPMSLAGAEPLRQAMGRLIENFVFEDFRPVTTVIEGDTAVVHWKGRVRATTTGKEAETEIVDIAHVENGKIVSFRQFVDTALAARLLSP